MKTHQHPDLNGLHDGVASIRLGVIRGVERLCARVGGGRQTVDLNVTPLRHTKHKKGTIILSLLTIASCRVPLRRTAKVNE